MLSTLILSVALAAPPKAGCLELKTIAQTEEVVIDESGQRRVQLVPAAKIVPGTEVIWTITANNVCAAPAANVAIDNPLPAEMDYVAGTALGVGSQIAFSLDGQRFGAPEQLQVREADGESRPARADEYRHIRFEFKNPIAPGQMAIARYRAKLK